MRRMWKAALVLVALLALAKAQVQATETEGPYEDIAGLLKTAQATASSLASLDSPGPPRVVTVVHDHHHTVPHNMPRIVAENIALRNTPEPPAVRVVVKPNAAKVARHAKEDAEYAKAHAQPSVETVDIKKTITVGPANSRHANVIRKKLGLKTVKLVQPKEWIIKGQRGDSKEEKGHLVVKGSGYHFPLVDRRLQRPRFSVIADLDGSDKASPDFKAHTSEDLKAEAAKLLAKAQTLRSAKAAKKTADEKLKKEKEALGVFDERDAGYEDEITRLGRVSARMNRLREQIELPHNGDSFLESIARKKYYLNLYEKLKKDATEIIEEYALRTGNSIFTMFGDGKIDPSIAAFLPPNSVAGILMRYTNPTQDRPDETPRDIISGRDAKRIQHAIDYYRAKKAGKPLPLPPKFAPTDEELREQHRNANPVYNKVVASQLGEFGQNRPAVTAGNQALGRSSVHISVVNPTKNEKLRGQPFQVNLKTKK